MSRPGTTNAPGGAGRPFTSRAQTDRSALRRTSSNNFGDPSGLFRTASNIDTHHGGNAGSGEGLRPRTPAVSSGEGGDYFAMAPVAPSLQSPGLSTMSEETAVAVSSSNAALSDPFSDEEGTVTPSQGSQASVQEKEQARAEALRRLRPPNISFSWKHKAPSIFVGWLIVLLLDLVVPCLLYYLLKKHTDLEDYTILGISVGALGLGELIELPLRMYRLGRYRKIYGPLGTDVWYHFDVVTWFYLALTVIAITPFAVSTSVDPLLYDLFLMSTGIVIACGALLAFITLLPIHAPFRLSSDPKGTPIKPAAYYVMEDFIAVDAGQGRRFRSELRARYEASEIFQKLLYRSTAWWACGGTLYVGVSLAVTYATDFDTAYGLIFGLLFVWILLWALANWYYTHHEMKREKLEWLLRHKDHE